MNVSTYIVRDIIVYMHIQCPRMYIYIYGLCICYMYTFFLEESSVAVALHLCVSVCLRVSLFVAVFMYIYRKRESFFFSLPVFFFLFLKQTHIRTQEGNSCLHIAAAQGSNEILRILLHAGAKVSAKNKVDR